MATIILAPTPPDDPIPLVDYHGANALCVPYGEPGHRPSAPFCPDVSRLLVHLHRDLTTLTVDEIDGEFYWRRCMFYRSLPLAYLRLRVEAESAPDLTYGSAGVVSFLRIQAQRGRTYLAALATAAEFFPYPVLRRLINDHRVPMRAPLVTRDAHQGTPFRYTIRVTSGAWRGADVEAALWDTVEHVERMGTERFRSGSGDAGLIFTDLPADDPTPEPRTGGHLPGDPSTVHVEFRLVSAAPEEDAEPAWTRQVPYVEVRIYLPLPPEGVLARQYDAVVRDRQQWHLALPGTTGAQDKEVALRTWAVGLLISDRRSFASAMREVHEAVGIPEVSQACFTADRKRLLERVPEARPYVYARKAPDSALAKGDPDPEPLQS